MGDPKFSTRKYYTPSHPWEGERITKENELIKKYGLKNKTELWRAQYLLSNFREQARNLLARTRIGDKQAELEKKLLLEKLMRMGFVGDNSGINDILAMDIEAILNRRFQSVVYMKGLANTQKQARQFITHGHVSIDGRKVTIPSYLVRRVEEGNIDYHRFSPLENELHPSRPRDEYDYDTQKPAPTAEAEPTEKKADESTAEAKPESAEEAEKAEEPKKEEEPKEGEPEQKTEDASAEIEVAKDAPEAEKKEEGGEGE